jgi:thiol-disulfide isomerase/thioredoxin
MGKASRTKRERREQEEAGGLPRIDPPRERRQLPVFWIVIALMVVAGIVALVVTAPDEDTKDREAKVADIPTYADVTVEGTKLEEATATDSEDGEDPAVGEQAPTLRGTSITTGDPLTITPGGGTAKVYVVMAHWCPHCNEEVPKLVEWEQEHGLPDGVEVVGVSTSADDGQANFPPATWLAREDWPWDALIDDEVGSAAEALGTSGFPFLVFVDADGTVARRFSGEMPIDDFAKEVAAIARTAEGGDA